MEEMENDLKKRIAEKLKKIKELADRGINGERETAIQMYEKLKARYDIQDEEIIFDKVDVHWFNYTTELEEELLIRIFWKVTGSSSYVRYDGKYSRRKKRGCNCTEIEAAEIYMLFGFYKEELKKELEAFMIAFANGNQLYPDETARCYEENQSNNEMTEEEKRIYKKAAFMSNFMDKNRPPQALIGQKISE